MASFPGFADIYIYMYVCMYINVYIYIYPYVHLYAPESTAVLTAVILLKANNMESINSIKSYLVIYV